MSSQVKVQQDDFNVEQLYQSLRNNNQTGGVVMFVGLVRDFTTVKNQQEDSVFELEHYPGMTEHNLAKIVSTAQKKWSLHEVIVVHRIGKLAPQEQIVFVGVSAEHRREAFLACDFIMDYLKSRAAFWKKETQTHQSNWVAASEQDEAQLQRWED
ncbi:molybdenum cofactor biosynthesis protein MoaE [Marinomonas agarivorans]|nr:molybdenum cofactor biosynthesis protein MoaE [Marinomonas agarivorans]